MIGRDLDAAEVVDRIEHIFERWGAQAYLGEPVTVAGHMLQCAALAQAEGAPAALVAAALLHDVGHFDNGLDDRPQETIDHRHEASAAAMLDPHFPPSVTEPIRLHVAAKRYLCATEPHYYSALSAASRHSLSLQGGPMDAAEIAHFRSLPFHQEAVRLRRWDDAGKAAELRAPGFADFRLLLMSVAR